MRLLSGELSGLLVVPDVPSSGCLMLSMAYGVRIMRVYKVWLCVVE